VTCRGTQRHTQPVGLYVHVPFCQAKCRYCGFYSEPIGPHDPQRLVRALLRELDLHRQVESIRTAYIGGGSPTALPQDLLVDLVRTIAARYPRIEEFTVECNPSQTGHGLLGRLREAGVNRVSIGVQSFHPHELELLGRCHNVKQIGQAVGQAKAGGFDNVGVDLIFAIPGSTIESWRSCLESAIALEVQHVSAYSLSFEQGTPLDKSRQEGRLQVVNEEMDRDMYQLTIQTLQEAGFEHYEVSNFARPGFACQHNIGYWLNRPFIGIGPSAASYWKGRRTTNVADIARYITDIESGFDPVVEIVVPTGLDRLCETAVLNLRMRDGIDLERFAEETGCDAMDVFAEPIRLHQGLGLIGIDADRVRLTDEALPIADSVLCDFTDIESVRQDWTIQSVPN